jgi:hypothetical protein
MSNITALYINMTIGQLSSLLPVVMALWAGYLCRHWRHIWIAALAMLLVIQAPILGSIWFGAPSNGLQKVYLDVLRDTWFIRLLGSYLTNAATVACAFVVIRRLFHSTKH